MLFLIIGGVLDVVIFIFIGGVVGRAFFFSFKFLFEFKRHIIVDLMRVLYLSLL